LRGVGEEWGGWMGAGESTLKTKKGGEENKARSLKQAKGKRKKSTKRIG